MTPPHPTTWGRTNKKTTVDTGVPPVSRPMPTSTSTSASTSARALLLRFESDPAGAAVGLASLGDKRCAEAFQSFSAPELQRLWKILTSVTDQALQDAQPAMEPGLHPEAEHLVEGAIRTLEAITTLGLEHISDVEREAPEELLDIAAALHDIIFDLVDPRASTLQSAIAQLCEAWWLGDRPGRDELVPQTATYLIIATLHERATKDDIKRLYNWRSALHVLDYNDESLTKFKKLLHHVAIKPLVLRCPEGRRLVAYLFSLDVSLIGELYRAIKAQIPCCRKSLREKFGEVLFRVWRAAESGDALVEIEERVLQDLMFHAIHASTTAMAVALRQILAYVHDQKRQRGVDQMLLKLWEPILFRALTMANPHVRRNAATLFVEAFPLQDSSLAAVELDKLLNDQFERLAVLLKDDCVSVRVVAVHGVCRVLALYWDLIPTVAAHHLLTTLVKELAHDAAANTVRIAVLTGLKYLLTQNISAPCLALVKGLLSSLAPLVHDGSERVRAAMLELCLVLSKVRGLHWQQLGRPEAMIEAMLARLPIERTPMQLRLTRLLLPLYLPSASKQKQAQTSRFVALIANGSPAARCMLTHSPHFATTSASMVLLRLLVSSILSDESNPEKLLEPSTPTELSRRTVQLPPAQLARCLDNLAVLVEALAPTLSAMPHTCGDDEATVLASSADSLSAVLTEAVMEAISGAASTSMSAQRALTRIAAWLPAGAVPWLSADCLRQIAASQPGVSWTRLVPLITCACAWKQDTQLLVQMHTALATPTASNAGSKRNRYNAPSELGASLALRVLWAALSTAATRQTLLERQSAALAALLPHLAATAAQLRTAASSADGDGVDDSLRALSCYLQLSWHLAENAAANSAAASSSAGDMNAGPARKGGRQTKASRAVEEAASAAAAAAEARDEGCRALSLLLEWGTLPMSGGSVCCDGSSGGQEPLMCALVEPSPGEARSRSRPRTQSAPEEHENASPQGWPADTASKTDSVRSPSMKSRVVACAWLAEGGMLGFLDPTIMYNAVRFFTQTLSTATADSTSSGAFTQLLPHMSKMILALIEPASADSSELEDFPDYVDATPVELGLELLFAFLKCGARHAEAAKAARPLLLELLLLLCARCALTHFGPRCPTATVDPLPFEPNSMAGGSQLDAVPRAKLS